MSTDGTDTGITAERALGTILGGEPEPAEDERQSPAEVEARVMAATPDSYSGATDCMTRALLRLYQERPETRIWPTSQNWDFTNYDPATNNGATTSDPDLYGAVKAVAKPDELEAFEGCTGFMWGFAVNQARRIVNLPEGSNPAIISIGGDA